MSVDVSVCVYNVYACTRVCALRAIMKGKFKAFLWIDVEARRHVLLCGV